MKKRFISALFAIILLLSLGITASADWKEVYHSSDASEDNPGKLYLDDIGANIEYPKKDDYLDEYKTRYVNPPDNYQTVYILHGINDGADWKKLASTIAEDTEVTVIAEHSYKSNGVKYTYSCCVYEKKGYEYAGWINNSYLSTKSSSSKTSGSKSEKHPFESDLDSIDANIEYPQSSDYLNDYKIKYVNNKTVYSLHGLNDGGDWKKLATKIEEGTKVVVIAEHSYKSKGVKYTYSCCIYEIDDYAYAGWINNSYLATKK